MTTKLDLDLQTDPTPGCQVKGPVTWKPGRWTLEPGGSISRALDLGSQAKLTLRLEFAPLTEDGQTSSTRFAYQVRNRGDFVVEIVRRRKDGAIAGEVRLIDRDSPQPRANPTQTLATTPWKGDFPSDLWTFRHHYGLVTVFCGDKRMVVGYAAKEPERNWVGKTRLPPPDQAFYQKCGIGEPEEVAGWSLEQEGRPVTCLAVSGIASSSYRDSLTPFWRGALAETRPENLRFGLREIDDLRARIDHRIRPEGGEALDSVQSPFEEWEKGEPDLRQLPDPSLTHVVQIFGKRHPYYALAVAGVGMQFFWVGNKDDVAERLLKQAAEVSEETLGTWHPDCQLVLTALARVYVKTGKLQLAELPRKKVLAATAAFGADNVRYAAALRELAVAQQYNGRLAEAETTLRQSVEMSKDAPRPQRADALIALGELQALMGERQKAAAAFKRAEEALEEELRHVSSGPADTYMPLYVPLTRARLGRARVLFRDGQKGQARQLARAAFLNLAQFNDEVGRGPGRFHGWGQEILNATPNGFLGKDPAYGLLMIDVGELFIALGDVEPTKGAIRVLDQVPGQTHHERGAIYRLMGHLCKADPNVNLGISPNFSERMRLDVAFNRPGPVFPPGQAPPKPARDRVLYWQKLAQEEFEKYAGREHPDTINLLQDQALRQWQQKGPAAAEPTLLDAFNRALVLLGDRVVPGLPEAEAYQFSEANPPPTGLLLSCYWAGSRERGREAYEAVWKAKALATRQFAERRQLLQAAAGRPDLAKLAEDLQTTRQQLAFLSLSIPPEGGLERRQKELARLTQRKEDLERELARQSESFRTAREAARAGVADLMGQLPAKTAIVDFVERHQWVPPAQGSGTWTQKRCYDAFVVRPAGGAPGWSAAWVKLEDADGLDRQLEEWVAIVRSGKRPPGEQTKQLRNRLWAPIEAKLQDCQTVVLIPDGRLAQVPWAALPGRREGTYLVEDYALVEAPYGQSVARLLKEPAVEGQGFLLVGGIDYGPGGKWHVLQGTSAEVDQLEHLRPGPETVRLGGEAATRARLLELLPGQRYVHLATHGEFLDPGSRPDRARFQAVDSTSGGPSFDVTARNPLLLSMLVLAGANRPVPTDDQGLPVGSDSFLTAEEVMGLDLRRTELVVLSACETGLGKVRGGEGVFSLQRAFHVSGSRAVVASLWQIPDQATQVLMRRFYENLWQKKMSKLEALRETQMWMLREGAKQPDLVRGVLQRMPEPGQGTNDGGLPPYYWAAFVLSGDWR